MTVISTWPIVQLYSPESEHDEQVIVVNAAGRAKLLELLVHPGSGSVEAITTDGEGFRLVLIETENADEFPLPYADFGNGGREPWRAFNIAARGATLAAAEAAADYADSLPAPAKLEPEAMTQGAICAELIDVHGWIYRLLRHAAGNVHLWIGAYDTLRKASSEAPDDFDRRALREARRAQ